MREKSDLTIKEITTGSLLGDYRLESFMGRGGCGYVFRASSVTHHLGEDKAAVKLAVKIASPWVDEPDPSQADGSTVVLRYKARGLYFLTGSFRCSFLAPHEIPEAMWQQFALIKKIKSELFPEVFEFSAKEDSCYFVMEFIDGPDFRSVLANGVAESRRNWVERLRDLVVSLSAIRGKNYGFYHGDIKPENIIVDRSGRFRLIDPGLRQNATFGVNCTITVPYNPLFNRGEEADTFAIATMIIEILIGRSPFAHLKRPYISMQRGYTKNEIEKHLGLYELKVALPASVNEVLVDWLLQPRSYERMLKEWDLLNRLC